MYAQRITVTVTTAADGSATAYSDEVLTGRVANVIYTKTDFADTVDFTITAESTGLSLWTDSNITASETVAPVQPGNLGSTGAASTLSEEPIFLANERIKIVVAQGGDTKTGTFTFVVV